MAHLDPTLEQTLELASDHHMAGRLGEAAAGYAQVLAQCPEHTVALHRSGILALQTGDPATAQGRFRRAATLDPGAWQSHCAEGHALTTLGRPQEALAAFQRGAALRPDSVDALLGLGDASMALGLRQEAAAAYRQVLGLAPGHGDALNNLGVALQELGRPGEAALAFQQALAQDGDRPMTHSNLGNALLLDHRVDEALAQLRATVARWPEHGEAQYNLGVAAAAKGEHSAAAAAYREAARLLPGHVAARNNLGNTLQLLGRHGEALEVYGEAMRLRPDFVDAFSNASAAARILGRMDEAIAYLRQALALRPDFAVGHGNLGSVLKDVGRMDEAIQCFRRALELDPHDPVSHSNLVYSLCFLPEYDAGAILAETLAWDRRHGAPLAAAQRPHGNLPDPARRLRIGYVSPNFREHVLAYFLSPLLSRHDPAAFEVCCYSLAPRPDAFTVRMMGWAQVWREAATLDDEQLAEQIRADGIDILVDLTMHMSSGRPLMFARKPAPVQVAWLAYPGTTGMAAMDYRFTDPNLDPPGTDACYAETSVRLPDVFSCYDPLATGPDPGPLPALANGFVTFGCFNNFCKVNAEVATLWCRVLGAVPGSRLLVLAQPGEHRQRLLERMAEGGVEPGRIEFVGFQPRQAYLELHRRVDVSLDTFPYNGHTTSLDALWMGVPVVTKTGRTVVGRTCWTLLCNLDLRELAASSDEQYLEIVTALAGDLPRLARLRATLRARMAASPLMDGPRFTRNMESAYRRMWTAWCNKQSS